MDNRLFSNRFGSTLSLIPSAYTFVSSDGSKKFCSTVCICVADEVVETYPQNYEIAPNVYGFDLPYTVDEFRITMAYKWLISNYVCCG